MHTFVDFHVDVDCNKNASDVCEIKFTYLLTYLLRKLPKCHFTNVFSSTSCCKFSSFSTLTLNNLKQTRFSYVNGAIAMIIILLLDWSQDELQECHLDVKYT